MTRLEELLLKLHDGSLLPEENEELTQLLEDPKARATLVDGFFMDHVIRQHFRASPKHNRAEVRVDPSGLASEEIRIQEPEAARRKVDLTPLRKPTTRRLVQRRDPSEVNTPWKWGIMAAAVLAAAVLILLVSPSGGSGSKNLGTRRAPVAAGPGTSPTVLPSTDRPTGVDPIQAQQVRRDAENHLRAIEEKRKALAEARPEQAENPLAQEKREQDLAELKREKERIEAELREAARVAKKAERTTAPFLPQEERPREEKPEAPPAAPSGNPQAGTQAAIARVEEAVGDAFRLTKATKVPLAPGTDLFATEGLETQGGASRVALRFTDRTRVDLGPNTMLSEVRTDGGKRLTLSQGMVRAVVAKQPKDQPMIVLTPHGQAKVVGTTLRLMVDPDPKKGTRLEVEEGKVELKNLAGRTVLVESGHYAVAAEGVELVARKLPSQKRVAYIFHEPQEGWTGVHQAVSLVPGQTYVLSTWIQTTFPNPAEQWGQFPGGSIGVRTETGTLVAQQPFGQLESLARTVLTFKAGPDSTAIIFAGFANGTDAFAWMHVTEWSLIAKGGDGTNLVQDPNYEAQDPASVQLSSPWLVEGTDRPQNQSAGQEPYRTRSPVKGAPGGERK